MMMMMIMGGCHPSCWDFAGRGGDVLHCSVCNVCNVCNVCVRFGCGCGCGYMVGERVRGESEG